MIDSDKERDAFIDEAIDVLRSYWRDNPNLRIGQVVVNAANIQGCPPYEMSDSAFIFSLGMMEGRRLRGPSEDPVLE